MKQVFVLCCDKSGSVWLAKTIARQCGPGVRVFHELLPAADWAYASAYWRGDIGEDEAARFVNWSRSLELWEATEAKATHYIEVNSGLFSMAKPIRAAVPGAVVVGLYRDGKDVVRSGRNLGWYVAHGPPNRPQQSYWETRRLMARPCDKFTPEAITETEMCAWYWSQMVGAFHDHADVSVFLEALTGESGWTAWCQFCEALELRPGEQAIYEHERTQKENATAVGRVPPFKDWPVDEQYGFWMFAGAMMKRLHYD